MLVCELDDVLNVLPDVKKLNQQVTKFSGFYLVMQIFSFLYYLRGFGPDMNEQNVSVCHRELKKSGISGIAWAIAETVDIYGNA